jgi:hypothetical protein
MVNRSTVDNTEKRKEKRTEYLRQQESVPTLALLRNAERQAWLNIKEN